MTFRVIDTGASNGFYNMAVDEALLQNCRHGFNRAKLFPTLRFYTFSPPAITIGRFQSTQDIELCNSLGIDVVRRITGGRAILHDGDLTYSLTGSVNHPFFGGKILAEGKVGVSVKEVQPQGVPALDGYKKMSLIFRDALLTFGVSAQLIRIKHSQYQKNSGCFSSVSRYELQVKGRKILGSAQRRKDGIILQQGSLLLNSKSQISNLKWHQSGLGEILGRQFKINEIMTAIKEAIQNMGIKIINSGLTDEEVELTNKLISNYLLLTTKNG